MKVRIPTKAGWRNVSVVWLDGAKGFIGETNEDKELMLSMNIITFQNCEFPMSVKCFMGVFEVIDD